MSDDYIEMEGRVVNSLPNGMFEVKLETGQQIICYISGKIRRNRINILTGDTVKVSVSTYDPSKGRITYRQK